ncbi:MAG: DUF2378 family protein [Myxococcaceae bacterium]|nr:DUF2378 family protein [Myxococcaceae bacterium]
MSENLIFAQTVEGLLRALGPLNEQDRGALKGLGLDVDKRLLPAYPLEQFISFLDFAGERLAPGATQLERAAVVGRRFMDGYQQTMVGRAMVAALRVIGPWRTLERLSNKFRTGNNFSQTTLTRLGPTEAEFWVNLTARPGWYVGLVGRGLELAGAKEVVVTLISGDDAGARYNVRWR